MYQVQLCWFAMAVPRVCPVSEERYIRSPFLRKHEANRLETSTVCEGRGLSPSAAEDHLGSGEWLSTAPLLFYLSYSQPSAIHVHCSTVLCLGSLGPGGPIIEAGCPITALTSPACMFTFWLPPSICLQVCLSIVEVGSCTPRGPASAPPLSLFRVQAAAMLELLAMLMDPFICHWHIQKDANYVLVSSRENRKKTWMKVFLPLHLLYKKNTALILIPKDVYGC